VSEFSQSYHLIADSEEDAAGLLRRADLPGFVFPPGNGWVTLIPDGDSFGEPLQQLTDANTGTLLWYMNAEDHGWMFTIFQGPAVACSYGCSWEDDLEIRDGALDRELLADIARATAVEPDTSIEQISRLLAPESRDHVLAYFMHTDGRNPGHGFAEAIGLEHFHRLSAASLAGGAYEVPLTRVEP
jgi:hypothetical protein